MERLDGAVLSETWEESVAHACKSVHELLIETPR